MIIYENTEYPSLAALVRTKKLNYDTVRMRIKNGMSVYEAINNIRLSDEFPISKYTLKKHNVSKKEYVKRRKLGLSEKEALKAGDKKYIKNLYKIQNHTFYTITDIAKYYNINRGHLNDRLAKGMNLDDAVKEMVASARKRIAV